MSAWIIELIIHYKYGILILATIPEGPILMIFSGVLIKLGYLSFWPAYFSLMAGDLISDVGWYAVGYFGGMKFVDRFGKFFGIDRKKIEIVSGFFHKYHISILFISKITTGFGFALIVLITAGLVKIPFKKYLTLNILGQFIWTGILVGIGYTFEHLYGKIENISGRATFVTLTLILVACLVRAGFVIHKKIQDGRIHG